MEPEQTRPEEEARRAAMRGERFLHDTIDALAEHIAIIDGRGTIAYVNRAWEDFARRNAAPALVARLGAGASYLEICDRAAERGAAAAGRVGEFIRAALAGQDVDFSTEYDCHSPDERRWFVVRVSAFTDGEARYAVVSHQNITARKLAELEVEQLNRDLEARVRSRTAQLERAEGEVRSLTRRLLQSEESERRRLGRELHDRVGQNLSALNLNLQVIRNRLSEESLEWLAGRMEAAQRQLQETTRDVRSVMADLRPHGLDDYGLITALRTHVDALHAGLGAEVAIEGEDPVPRPAIETETALFRIAQEALANAAKHARASRIEVRLESAARGLRLTVADNGVGFVPDPGRVTWGMLTMRERAEAAGAHLEVDSALGRGTRVSVQLRG